MASPKERKIRLFRAMFSGRADVYARRWVGREGKSGYSPVCSAEWVRGVCDKKRVACAVCPNRRFAPLDAAAIDSYDRIFPNQDRFPKGGFGNLIALPLQGQSRRRI